MSDTAVTQKIGDVTILTNREQETVTTVWPDQLTLVAKPNHDHASYERATSLGYTGITRVWEMTADHDRLHHTIAVAQGDPWSAHLRRIAERQPLTEAEKDAGHREECLVFLLTRALNGLRWFEL